MPNVYQPITQSGKWPGSFDMLSKAMPQKQQAPQQQGSQKPPDMSMYSPGQARPVQTQSQGTPYGAQFTGGNYAYATPENRPAPFTARYTNFDGSVSDQPNFGQRDAFIQNINDAMLPYYTGQAKGPPQFDFQSMYRRAGDMVKDGWQNPFAQPPVPRQPASGDPGMNDALGPAQQPARQQIYAPAPRPVPSVEEYLARYAPQTQYRPGTPVVGYIDRPQFAPQAGNPLGANNYGRGQADGTPVLKAAPGLQLFGLRAAGDQNRVRSEADLAFYRNNPNILM